LAVVSTAEPDVHTGSSLRTLVRWGVLALPWVLLAAGVARIVLALTVSQTATGVRLGNDFVDLGVYRLGGRALLDGQPLYDAQYQVADLPFTYPVFAAVLFVPLALVPFGAAQVLMVALSLTALAVSAAVVAARLPATLGRPLPWSAPVSVLGLFGLGGMLEPTTTTLDLGQVNLLLMAMVLVDLLVRWRGSGVLVGIATGVKLVPGVFVLAMAAGRRWRQVLLAGAAFAGTVLVGAAVDPAASWTYWTRMFYKDDRQASVVTILNQSLYADLVRLLGRDAGLLAWVVVAAAVLVAGLVLATRLWPRDALASVVTVAITGLLVSPVSWNHHWVWLMPALAVSGCVGVRLWEEGRQAVASGVLAVTAVCLVVTAVGPIKLASESLEFDDTLGSWLVANSLTWAGAAFLALMWLVAARPAGRTAVRR
jgi:alpha-1,2-mannosyltransferase